MDGDNQNKAKDADYPNIVKNKQNPPQKEILVRDDNGQNNELSANQNKGKAKFVANDIKNKPEKPEPKQRELNSKKNHQKSGKNFEGTKNLTVKEKPQKKINPKKSFKRHSERQNKDSQVLDEECEDTFELEDILHNSTVLELIQELVNSFTSNSTLPENELQTLKVSLFERACYVLLNILNSCVKKTFTKVMNTDFLQEFKNKVVSKKDAGCQTSMCNVTEAIKKPEEQKSFC